MSYISEILPVMHMQLQFGPVNNFIFWLMHLVTVIYTKFPRYWSFINACNRLHDVQGHWQQCCSIGYYDFLLVVCSKPKCYASLNFFYSGRCSIITRQQQLSAINNVSATYDTAYCAIVFYLLFIILL